MKPALAAIAERAVEIRTPAGICDAVLVSPGGGTASPAIVFYPDVKGLRPVKAEMAKRLAARGFAVLVVNQFYRIRKAPIFPQDFHMADANNVAAAMQLVRGIQHDQVVEDAVAFFAFLESQPEVDARAKFGVIGFCIGGTLAIRTAIAAPDRIGAVASFHGGFLVTPAADSPHRLLRQVKADFLIAIAADDDAKQPGAKDELINAAKAAQLDATVEVYAGTRHGWMVPDASAFDALHAERGWEAALPFFERLHAVSQA